MVWWFYPWRQDLEWWSLYLFQVSLISRSWHIYQILDVSKAECSVYFIICFSLLFKLYSLYFYSLYTLSLLLVFICRFDISLQLISFTLWLFVSCYWRHVQLHFIHLYCPTLFVVFTAHPFWCNYFSALCLFPLISSTISFWPLYTPLP